MKAKILITDPPGQPSPDDRVVLAVFLTPTLEELQDLKLRHKAYAREIQRQFDLIDSPDKEA